MIKIRFAGIEDLPTIERLAREIWPGTYGHILSAEQLDYMLNLIYSQASLQNQLQNQHQTFVIAELDNEAIGFASWSLIDDKVCKLHKLYVHQKTQGKGIGKMLVEFLIEQIQPQQVKTLRLNVNRYNQARLFYEKLGFTIVAEEDIDIGNGYLMIDYIMEKPI